MDSVRRSRPVNLNNKLNSRARSVSQRTPREARVKKPKQTTYLARLRVPPPLKQLSKALVRVQTRHRRKGSVPDLALKLWDRVQEGQRGLSMRKASPSWVGYSSNSPVAAEVLRDNNLALSKHQRLQEARPREVAKRPEAEAQSRWAAQVGLKVARSSRLSNHNQQLLVAL